MKERYLPYLMPIRSILFLLIFIIGSIITDQELSNISYWWSIVASFVNIITILMLIYITKKSKTNYWKLINFQKGKTKIIQIVGVSIAILLIGMAGMYFAGYICYGTIPYIAPMMIAPIPIWLAIINVLILPITTAFVEEGLYLGCGVNHIKNKYAAIIIPSLCFALQHCFIPTLFDTTYIIYRFLSFVPLTIILCSYYYKSRNPIPIMVGHTIIDTATVIQILVMSITPGLYETMIGI